MNSWKIFKTRNQCNLEAIEYNPKVAKCLESDDDYCVRGMIKIKGFELYCDVEDYKILLRENKKQLERG